MSAHAIAVRTQLLWANSSLERILAAGAPHPWLLIYEIRVLIKAGYGEAPHRCDTFPMMGSRPVTDAPIDRTGRKAFLSLGAICAVLFVVLWPTRDARLFWSDDRIVDLWLTIGLFVTAWGAYWSGEKWKRNWLKVIAGLICVAALFLLFCVRCAP